MKPRMLTFIALGLTAIVISLGALTRLLDAGLGCPDWPGCYGQLSPPSTNEAAQFADLHTGKAWMEMIHRYAAGLLGLILVGLTVCIEKTSASIKSRWLARSILMLVIIQAAFGMWTVTLKLQPQIVTLHLVFGMLLLSLMWALWRSLSPSPPETVRSPLKLSAFVILVLLFCQVALGGWTSSQYAGLACPDFPTCQGQWLPQLNLHDAFRLSEFTDANHEGGLLALESRMTIQVVHRLVALLLTMGLISLCLSLWRYPSLRKTLGLLMLFTFTQLSLGIANAVLLLPLPLALAHNTGAALLLLCLLDLCLRLNSTPIFANNTSKNTISVTG